MSRLMLRLALLAALAPMAAFLVSCATETPPQDDAAKPAETPSVSGAMPVPAAPAEAKPVEAPKPEFSAWLESLRAEAKGKGIKDATIIAALTDIKPIPRVIELDRQQPEFKLTFRQYMDRVAGLGRVEKGRAKYKENRKLADEVAKKYGVPARVFVALWGIETDFGRITGGFPVVPALATLAYDGRRSAFFRGELMNALKILDDGHIQPKAMVGSWAGAMGQVQFMPSSFLNLAIDYNGDGRRDLWNSLPDVMGSAANYLSKSGWKADQGWGREAKLPDGFDDKLISMDVRKTVSGWGALGVTAADGKPLPASEIEASLVRPEKDGSGPVFLVYDNYRVILKWNRSHFFALAAGHLADSIGAK
jgi:membrane-bound lytic murein transglycosylase B